MSLARVQIACHSFHQYNHRWMFRFAFLFKEDLGTTTPTKSLPRFPIALKCDRNDFRKR